MITIDEILTMLETIEFCAGEFEPHCPVCWGRKVGGHSSICRLGILINNLKKVKGDE